MEAPGHVPSVPSPKSGTDHCREERQRETSKNLGERHRGMGEGNQNGREEGSVVHCDRRHSSSTLSRLNREREISNRCSVEFEHSDIAIYARVSYTSGGTTVSRETCDGAVLTPGVNPCVNDC